jgi:16S rRNA (cytosine967-C5)-methyltransferase
MSAHALAGALSDAARMVARVAAGASLAGQLERAAEEGSTTPRAALLDLTHGTLRRYGRVQKIVAQLSRRGTPDPQVEALLWCSLYALESGRYAEYTVVDQAVRACRLLQKWNANGYVNAVLRGSLRERTALEARISADLEAAQQHPRWWIEALRAAWPEQWKQILAAGNSHPPMALRVNRRRGGVEAYQARLAAEQIAARRIAGDALLLERPVPVERLPGFGAGDVSVQDAAAQRTAACLDLASGQRILDACAAPGGKTAHILETADVQLTAIDLDAERTGRIVRNLERLGLSAEKVVTADCRQPAQWWDGVPFDRILADVPCSASGVVRRHPDVKWLRRAQDIEAFAVRQGTILDALWQVLGPGGKLLYVTCSVFPQENEAVLEAFLRRAPQASRLELADGGPAQWLPGAEHDGFYHALIQKRA